MHANIASDQNTNWPSSRENIQANNSSQPFNSYNSSSPYYQNIIPSLNTTSLTAVSTSSSSSTASSAANTPQSQTNVLNNSNLINHDISPPSSSTSANTSPYQLPSLSTQSSNFDQSRVNLHLVNAYQSYTNNFANYHSHYQSINSSTFYPPTPPKDLNNNKMNKPENKSCNDSNNSIASEISESSNKKKNNKSKNKKLSIDSITTTEEDSLVKSENEEAKKIRKDSNKSSTDESNVLLDTEEDNMVEDDDEEFDEDEDFKNYDGQNNWQQTIDHKNEIIYNNVKIDSNNSIINANNVDLKWSPSNLNNNLANQNINKFSNKKKALPGN